MYILLAWDLNYSPPRRDVGMVCLWPTLSKGYGAASIEKRQSRWLDRRRRQLAESFGRALFDRLLPLDQGLV